MRHFKDYTDQAYNILQLTKEFGGTTYKFSTDEYNPTTGAIVANGKHGCQFEEYPEVAYLASMMRDFEKFGFDGVGTWVSGSTLYIDPVIHVETLLEARALGYLYGEKAVYDCVSKKVVELELAGWSPYGEEPPLC